MLAKLQSEDNIDTVSLHKDHMTDYQWKPIVNYKTEVNGWVLQWRGRGWMPKETEPYNPVNLLLGFYHTIESDSVTIEKKK